MMYKSSSGGTKWPVVMGMLAVLLMAALPLMVRAQQTDNHELRAAPAPGKVVVDGRLDEWDASGQILLCADVNQELDRYAVHAAAMHDRDNLYLSFHFVDQTPLVNYIDPIADPAGSWRADSVEIRMAVDGRSIHWQTHYWTPKQQPVVQFFYGGTTGDRVIPRELRIAEKGERAEEGRTGVIYDGLSAGVQEAFRRHEDGKGYTQELAIPWKLLTKDRRSFGVGDQMRMGLQVNWGDASGGLTAGMPQRRYAGLVNPEHPQRSFFGGNPEAWGTVTLLAEGNVEPSSSMKLASLAGQLQQKLYRTSGPVAIEYELPVDGYVTLVVEKPDGTRVRNLISDYPREKGKNTDYWDGRDDRGQLVAPGDYRVRGLFHEKLDVKYRFHFGNPNPIPWATADGRGGWLSNHGNHLGILADEERIYVSAPEAEGPYPLIALDYNGNKLWGGLARWYAGFLAQSGDYLYTVNDQRVLPARDEKALAKPSQIELIRLDPRTGREVPFPDNDSKHTLATWRLHKQGAAKKWQGWTVEHAAFDADWAGINPQGLAALDGTLYLSLHFDDKLLKISAETGKVIGEIPLESPAGLVSDPRKGRLLAISGQQVVEVDPESGQATPVITDHLKAPIALAVDSKGRIYVSDWADQMCVKVFSPGGRYLKYIGRMGGRPWVGRYDPQGMLLPHGITIDAKDRLWVAESSFNPRRISLWDTDSGKLVMEKIGRGRYGGMGYYVLPDRPEQAILNNNLIDLDWDGGRWRVSSTLWSPTKVNEVIGFDPYTRFGQVIHHDGRRLVVHTSRRPQHGPVVISELTEDGRAAPLAAVGPVVSALPHVAQRWQGGFEPAPIFAEHLWTDARMLPAARDLIPWFFEGTAAGDIRAVAAHYYRRDIFRRSGIGGRPKTHGAPNANFAWSDLDRDGGVDENEITYYSTPGLEGPLPVPWRSEAWSGGVVSDDLSIYLTAVQDKKAYHYRLPVSRWTDDGVPIYSPRASELIAESSYMGEVAWLSREENILTLGNIPGNFDTRDPLVMYRPDGSIAWTYPSSWTGVHGSHTAPKEKRGQLIGPLGVFGKAELEGVGEIFAFHTNVGTAEFFTSDGLYLGRLFRDSRSAAEPWPEHPTRGQSLNNMSNGGEWFGGQFFQRPDGKMYVICSRSAGVIAQVTGLETTRRLGEQPIQFTVEQYEAARAQIAEAARDQEEVKTVQVASMKGARGLPPMGAFRWDVRHSASWRYDQTHSAKATWSYDDRDLYVVFQVKDQTPMVNSGEDVRRLFKFGDAAILELRTDPDKRSQQAVEGDLRLLFSVHNNQPIAVLYDYRRPGAEDPVEFTSVKATRIDRVAVLAKAKVAIDRTEEGYTLRAAVPLKDLGWKPEPGRTYPGDFGIVYSDRTGTKNALRMYWSNQATGIVSDLSLEADIQPGNWGRFEVAAP